MTLNPALVILLVAMVTAAWTDLTRHKIYNWTTYPAISLCLAAAGTTDGFAGLRTALLGLACCGGLLLVAHLCLDVGGGDVKLAALMGCGLGWLNGLYALLWTFTLAAAIGISFLIWQIGAVNLLRRLWMRAPRAGPGAPLEPPAPLQQPLFLAPAALVAVLIVLWPRLAAVRT